MKKAYAPSSFNNEDIEEGEISDEGQELATSNVPAQQYEAVLFPVVRWLTHSKEAVHIGESSGNSSNSREVVLGQCSLDDLKRLSADIGASVVSGNCNHRKTWVAAITAHVDALGLDPVNNTAIPLRFTLPARTRRPMVGAATLFSADIDPPNNEEPRRLSPPPNSAVTVEPEATAECNSANGVESAAAVPTAVVASSIGGPASVSTQATEARRPRRSRFTDAPLPAPSVGIITEPASTATDIAAEANTRPTRAPAEPTGPPAGRQHGTVHRTKPDGSGTIFQTKLSEKLTFQASAVLGEIINHATGGIEPAKDNPPDAADLPSGITALASPNQRLRRGDKVTYRIVSQENKAKGAVKWVAVDIVRITDGAKATIHPPGATLNTAPPQPSMLAPLSSSSLPGFVPASHGANLLHPPPYAPFPGSLAHGHPQVPPSAHGQHGMPPQPKPPPPPPHPLGQGANISHGAHPPDSPWHYVHAAATVGQQMNNRLSMDQSRENRAALELAVMQEYQEVRAQFLNVEQPAPPSVRPSVAAAVAAAVNVNRANPQPPSLPPPPVPPRQQKPPSLPPPPPPLPPQHPQASLRQPPMPPKQPKPPSLPPPPPLPPQHPQALLPPPPVPSKQPKPPSLPPPPPLPPQHPQAALPPPPVKHSLPPPPVLNLSTASQSSAIKPMKVRRRSRFQDAQKVDDTLTGNGKPSVSGVGTKDRVSNAREGGGSAVGFRNGSNVESRGATDDQHLDMEIDDEREHFSGELEIKDQAAVGMKEDESNAVGDIKISSSEIRGATDDQHLDMEIDDDNDGKIELSKEVKIEGSEAGVKNGGNNVDILEAADNQQLGTKLDDKARVNLREEGSSSTKETSRIEPPPADAALKEDEPSTSVTMSSVVKTISQPSTRLSQEDKLRAEVLKSLSGKKKNDVPPASSQKLGLLPLDAAVELGQPAASAAALPGASESLASLPIASKEAIASVANSLPPPPKSVAGVKDYLATATAAYQVQRYERSKDLPVGDPTRHYDNTCTDDLPQALPAVSDKREKEVLDASETSLIAQAQPPDQAQLGEESRPALKNKASEREQALRAAVLQSFAKSKKNTSSTAVSTSSSRSPVSGVSKSPEPAAEPLAVTAAEPGSVDDIAAFLNAHTAKWQAQRASQAQVQVAVNRAEAVAAVELETPADEEESEKSKAGNTNVGETSEIAATTTTVASTALVGQPLVQAPSEASSLSALKAIATKIGIISPKGNKSKKSTWVKAIEHELQQRKAKQNVVVADRVQKPQPPSARTPPPLTTKPNSAAVAPLARASLSTNALAASSGKQHPAPMPQHLKAYTQRPVLTISDDDGEEGVSEDEDTESESEDSERGSRQSNTMNGYGVKPNALKIRPSSRLIVRHEISSTVAATRGDSKKMNNGSAASLRGSGSFLGKKRPAVQSIERDGGPLVKAPSMLPAATDRAASAAAAAVTANTAQVSAAEQSAADDRLLAMTNEIARMKQLITMREAAKREAAAVAAEGSGTSSSAATHRAKSPPQETRERSDNLVPQDQEQQQGLVIRQNACEEGQDEMKTKAAVDPMPAVEEQVAGTNEMASSVEGAIVELKEVQIGKKRKALSAQAFKSAAKGSDVPKSIHHSMAAAAAIAADAASSGAATSTSVVATSQEANLSAVVAGAPTSVAEGATANSEGRVTFANDSDTNSSNSSSNSTADSGSSAVADSAISNANTSSRERFQSLASRQANLRFMMEAARDFKAIETFAQRVMQSRIQLQHAEGVLEKMREQVSELSSGVGKLRQERDSVSANCLDASAKRLQSLVQVVNARRNAAANTAQGPSNSSSSSATLTTVAAVNALPPPVQPNRRAATSDSSLRLK